jgi:hypothetical protein
MAVRVEANAEPIPGYRLIERLGGGGFGEVWRASAPGGMHKAIKFVFGDLSGSTEDGQRAEQELKALKRVQSVRHPYILSLERYDVVEGQLMIVMELADRNLWDRYKECRTQGRPGIPREELLGYMRESAEALDLMNSQYQLQHLDIKPQNIFLIHQHVKVADFGLVKDLEGSHASVTGGITPVYAAPETFEGMVTRYTDQYSLAIVYQELLTGQRPFNGSNVRQLILQHIQGTPNLNPLPPGDRPAIARALSKQPQERFATCRALVDALMAGEGGAAGEPGVPCFAPGPGLLLPGGSAPGTVPVERAAQSADGPSGGWTVQPPTSSPVTANVRVPTPDTGSGNGTTQSLRSPDAADSHAGTSARFQAPPEIKGPGTLFPALVLGLGQMALTVMQRLRAHLATHLGPPARLEHLRFVLIDTDPDVVRQATSGAGRGGLSAGDVVLAPLNRPSYYLKPRDGRPHLEKWLNPRILYRIPRSQVTTGVRILGRLAFTDHYRVILRRLQAELQAALEPQALANAARQTGLGVRSNRPRVYVIAGVAGGTGGGMFLDAAYTVRALLRRMGYENPDVVGLLLLPAVDRSRTRVLPLGNAYAALTELNYFGSPGTTFQARYHEREAPVEDDQPPFTRTILLPLPDESDEVATGEVVEQGGQMLYRDLTTPLGRVADLGRAGLAAPPWDARGQYYQTFGLFQLTWPRHGMLQAVARRLCQRLVVRWMSKDSKPLREAVQTWVQDQWAIHELGADHFLQRLQACVVKALGKPAEARFAALIEPLEKNVPGSWQGQSAGETGSRANIRLRRGDSNPAVSPVGKPGLGPPEVVAAVLGQLEELFSGEGEEGSPETSHSVFAAEQKEPLPEVLKRSAEQLGVEWGQKLAELAVRLIEEPEYRLAGAEEAVRQLVATIEQVLQHHEPLARDLARRADEARGRLAASASAVGSGPRKGGLSTAEAVELLRQYAKSRYQALLLHHLTGTFVSLRGHLSDQLREVGFCRVRLGDLLHKLEEAPAEEQEQLAPYETAGRPGGVGRVLFFSGCANLREAVEQFLQGLTAEHLLELDGAMEEMLRAHFTALVHVCLTSANILKNVEAAMLQTARDYAAGQLPRVSVAQLFFEQHPDEAGAGSEVVDFHDEAAPELAAGRSPRGPGVAELCVLAAPADEAGERFRATVEKALAETEVHHAPSDDDIVVYRERNNLPLADLEHLGPVGHDAYVQMNTAENFTPHSRCDVDFRTAERVKEE